MLAKENRKVLFLLDCLYGDAGGGSERQFLKLYDLSDAMEIDPYVVFLRNEKVHSEIAWRKAPLVLDVGPIVSMQAARAVFRLKKFLRQENIRIVHTLFDDASIIGAALKSLVPSTNLVVSQRNLGYSRQGIKKLLIGKVLRACDKVVVNASAIADFLGAQYGASPQKIMVINNIHDEQPVCESELVRRQMAEIRSKHRAIAVIVANLRPIKGIDDLLGAVEITRQVMDIGYVIVGDGGGLAHYNEILQKSGLEKEIYLVGYQQNAACYVKEADIAILPSRSEGLSNSLVEYMFAGLPIVATDVGGSREALDNGRCGRLVPAENPRALAQAIMEVLNGGGDSKAMGVAARESAMRRYNRDSILRAYRHLYWSLG